MRALTWSLVGCLALSLAACGDDGDPSSAETVTRLVGVEGATVALAGGGKVTIPPGALTESVQIKITKLDLDDVADLPPNVEAAGKPYAFEPHGQVFAQNVKIELPYEGEGAQVRPLKLPNETAESSEWTTVFPSGKDEDNAKLSFDTTSFSVIVAARPRRNSGVITLPDGAVTPEDAGTSDTGVAGTGGTSGTGGDSGEGGVGGTGGTGGTAGTGGTVATDWLRQFGTSGDTVEGVAVDSAGNVYIAGTTSAALPPDQINAGGIDAFIRKYDANGVEQWTREFGTDVAESLTAIAIRGDRVVVVGSSAGVFDQETLVGGSDCFVRVYDTEGVEQWTRRFGSLNGDQAFGVAIDSDGNIYTSGSAGYDLPGQARIGSNDAFVRQYAADGTEGWTRQFGSGSNDWAYGIAVDSQNNVLVAGTTQGTVTGQTTVGSNDAFVRKYDSSGTEIWTHQFGTSDIDRGYAVAADADDNVFVAGSTRGVFTEQTIEGGDDVFLRKYDSDGVVLWTHQFGTTGTDDAHALATNAAGDVVVVGSVSGALPGKGALGSNDVYARAYESVGVELWTHQFGTRGSDYGLAVALDATGRTIVGGRAGSIFPGQMNQNTVPAALVNVFLR